LEAHADLEQQRDQVKRSKHDQIMGYRLNGSTKNGCQQLFTQLHPQNQHPRHPVDQKSAPVTQKKSRLLQARQVVGCLSETSETPKIPVVYCNLYVYIYIYIFILMWLILS
jgi:hypothetical protein